MVDYTEIFSSIADSETPVNFAFDLVGSSRPSFNHAAELAHGAQAPPTQAFAYNHTDFSFGLVQSHPMLGRVVNFKGVPQAAPLDLAEMG
jgi:hypothetical protein